jgi:hypothetical protein
MRSDQPSLQFQGNYNMLEIGYQSRSHSRVQTFWKAMPDPFFPIGRDGIFDETRVLFACYEESQLVR